VRGGAPVALFFWRSSTALSSSTISGVVSAARAARGAETDTSRARAAVRSKRVGMKTILSTEVGHGDDGSSFEARRDGNSAATPVTSVMNTIAKMMWACARRGAGDPT